VTWRSRLGPLRERPFRLLFLGRSISLLGGAFAPVALAFAVIDDLEGSASQLGLVLAAIWVPEIVFVLIGGIWADRLPRHLVMVGTDLIMFAAQATVAVLLITGEAEIWHLFATQLVRGVANAFFHPAATGLVPHVVSPDRLQSANAVLRLSLSTTQVLGAASAGLLVAAVGPGWALAFDALTFLASAGLLARLPLPREARLGATNFLAELREGWVEFRSRTWLWTIAVQFLFINGFAFGVLIVLGPVIAKEELGGAAAWGAILACLALGHVAGGLLALRLHPERLLLVATLAIFLEIPQYLLLAAAAPLLAIALAALVAGVGDELFGVFWDTTLQQQIPHEKLSRVSSYDALGSFVAIPIGLSIVGPISAGVGVETTLVLATAVVALPTLAVLLVPDVRRLRSLQVGRPASASTDPHSVQHHD